MPRVGWQRMSKNLCNDERAFTHPALKFHLCSFTDFAMRRRFNFNDFEKREEFDLSRRLQTHSMLNRTTRHSDWGMIKLAACRGKKQEERRRNIILSQILVFQNNECKSNKRNLFFFGGDLEKKHETKSFFFSPVIMCVHVNV